MELAVQRLEAGSTTEEALERMTVTNRGWVVVRLPGSGGPQWYAVPTTEVAAAFRDAGSDSLVATALSLRERPASRAARVEELEGVDAVDETTVVLAGPARVVGILPAGAAVPDALSSPDTGAVLADAATRRSAPMAAPAGTTAPGGVVSADPRLDGPVTIALGESFDLTISLSDPSGTEDEGRIVFMPEGDLHAIELDVQLFAEGFDCADGIHAELPVDPANVRASAVTKRLTAVRPPMEVMRLVEAGETSVWEASITANFMYQGRPVGWRKRRVFVVVSSVSEPSTAVDPTIDLREPLDQGSTITLSSLPTPDLTIVINDSDPADAAAGRYTVTLTSPHATMPPGLAYPLVVRQGAANWSARVTQAIRKLQGSMIYEGVRGQGSLIANLLPRDFWDKVNATLRHVAATEDRTPTVLLSTSDPHIPWELAYLGETPVDDTAPPFLAAQARMGRWVIDPPNDIPMAPELEIDVHHVAAVIGEYPEGGSWDPLPQAVAEGQYLSGQFGATYRTADGPTIEALFKRTLRDPPQLMHFACHGTSGQGGNALLSNDGSEFFDFMFEVSAAGREDHPFVFLNACRAGVTAEGLTGYGGFAATFLRSGFRGFVGPLWDVDDAIAHEIAKSFYERAADGESPAEILRSVRARFVDEEGKPDPPPTYMAYVYYGHPAATITGLQRPQMS